MNWICDEARLAELVRDIAGQIVRGRAGDRPMALVGIRTRGLPLAERLAAALRGQIDCDMHVGAVDTTLYRDDLDRANHWPDMRGTDVPFGVEGAEVVLVDDVLQTGRSARAALNIVCDLGRPAVVRLAVVVDRGGRELPIQADYVGMWRQASPGDRIVVRVRPIDESEGIEHLLSPH